MSDEPFLFRMRWRGYDPAEVTECYLMMAQSFEAYARTMEAEREVRAKEILKWMDRVEEDKECLKKLREELEAERRENARLRLALARSGRKNDTVSGAGVAAGPASPSAPPRKDFRSGF